MDLMPTAMVGGSFDPIHLGHLHLIHTVAEQTEYRRIILVPVGRNHFKPDARPLAAHHRLAMIHLACAHYRTLYSDDMAVQLVVEECELNRVGISYTYDTVTELYRRYPIKDRLAVVMGDDLLADLNRWYGYEELKRLVSFVIIRREEQGLSFADPGADLRYLDNRRLEDSSTTIRAAMAALGPDQAMPPSIADLLSPEVAAYIERERLYRL